MNREREVETREDGLVRLSHYPIVSDEEGRTYTVDNLFPVYSGTPVGLLFRVGISQIWFEKLECYIPRVIQTQKGDLTIADTLLRVRSDGTAGMDFILVC